MKIFAISLALAAAVALGACSSTGVSLRTRSAQQAIVTVNTAHCKITGVHAFETRDALYVTGAMHRSPGHSIPVGAHVDVELLDPSGRVIAARQDRITPVHPRQEKRGAARYSFAIGFPLAVGREANRIRVSYHLL